jgi:citrate lyase subunit beta/citryl-CoA lyase
MRDTAQNGLFGYMIPKFEDIARLKEFIEHVVKREKEFEIKEKLKIILMVESPKGLLELRNIDHHYDKNLSERIAGLALGGEDYLENLTISGKISKDMIGFARMEIILFARAKNILAIDTVYPDFRDTVGLEEELKRIISMGFTSKLAIHPTQVEIINSGFCPNDLDIGKMEKILSHRKDIEDIGVISIDGVMYEKPHLRWALKLKKYLDELNN